jgi:hypothetical protein
MQIISQQMGVGYSKERDLSIGAEEEEPSEH